jgi:hypothetical protein
MPVLGFGTSDPRHGCKLCQTAVLPAERYVVITCKLTLLPQHRVPPRTLLVRTHRSPRSDRFDTRVQSGMTMAGTFGRLCCVVGPASHTFTDTYSA